MKTVKIPEAEYVAVKRLATKQGRLLQAVLTDALRHYIGLQKSLARGGG